MVNRKDLASGFCMLLLGIWLAYQATRLSVWKGGPNEGFFPLMIAILMMGLSLGVMLKGLLRPAPKEEGAKGERTVFTRVVLYAILMFLYGALLEAAGFVITTLLFLVFVLKFAEKQQWKRTIIVGVLSVLASYLLFVYALDVPLSRGLWSWW
jgi:putative tricarboxylic transport membrane protein